MRRFNGKSTKIIYFLIKKGTTSEFIHITHFNDLNINDDMIFCFLGHIFFLLITFIYSFLNDFLNCKVRINFPPFFQLSVQLSIQAIFVLSSFFFQMHRCFIIYFKKKVIYILMY